LTHNPNKARRVDDRRFIRIDCESWAVIEARAKRKVLMVNRDSTLKIPAKLWAQEIMVGQREADLSNLVRESHGWTDKHALISASSHH
jgi:hypothetical protein